MATIAQEYIQEGIEKGLEQGVEKSILRVLARRFGAVPAEVQTQLDTLTLADLETLFDAAVEVDDLSAFAARLAAIAKPGG
ncbi:MAG: DUF4351 domain-containing protein [Ardenticatenaceae bacterium]|nr:DUF4351 domain-containing protein [Ardenticatenaceae bacterium]